MDTSFKVIIIMTTTTTTTTTTTSLHSAPSLHRTAAQGTLHRPILYTFTLKITKLNNAYQRQRM